MAETNTKKPGNVTVKPTLTPTHTSDFGGHE